jgi:WD40 repeat protein
MRHWILIAALLAGMLLTATPVHAGSKASSLCPYTNGQYYRPILPFFDYRNKQVRLVERYTYNTVQVLADQVQEMYFLGYEGWSPSCRYFAFAVGPMSANETVIWDTVDQKQIGTFHRKTHNGLHVLTWGDTDNSVIVGTIVGQFLWKIPSNEQIQMNDHDGRVYYRWDTPRNQVLTFDGSYVVVYDLNSGKIVQKYFSPFYWYLTRFDFTPDGKTLTLFDPDYDKWSVTWDRSTGMIIDAKAGWGRRLEEVQFSPDRRFLVIGGYGVTIYNVKEGNPPELPSYVYYAFIEAGNYSWRFIEASTLELTYKSTGKQRLYDLTNRKFR